MADPNQSSSSFSQQHEDEEEEVSKLEKEIEEMCEKISEYRDNMPRHLHTFLSSQQTTPLLLPSSSTMPISEENGAALVEEVDPSRAEKIQSIKNKISDNASSMSSLLKRMKDCMSRIDKLESFNKGTHPAFKRRKIVS